MDFQINRIKSVARGYCCISERVVNKHDLGLVQRLPESGTIHNWTFAEPSREKDSTQHLKTDNPSKAHLYAESTTPFRDSLEKERKFASVCSERRFINGCEKVSTCQHFPR